MKEYGVVDRTIIESDIDLILEEIHLIGFTVIPDIVGEDKLSIYRKALDRVYEIQLKEFGQDHLKKINELNSARALLVYDEVFLELLKIELIHTLLHRLLGPNYVLSLQNGIINRPNEEHHQSSWHRDLPYQDYVVSKPIAINVFFCLDRFSKETGGTVVLPYSHRMEKLPSAQYIKKFEFTVNASPGSVIIFNTWLYHRSGYNSSDQIRRGINNLFTVPIIRQQINLPKALNGKYQDDHFLSKILGYRWPEAESVLEYRKQRFIRTK